MKIRILETEQISGSNNLTLKIILLTSGKDMDYLMGSNRKVWNLSLDENKINICDICKKELQNEININKIN
jgi:hypothetical protein